MTDMVLGLAAFAASFVLGAPPVAHSDSIPFNRENRWIYMTIAEFKKDGLWAWVGECTHCFGPPIQPRSIWEVAVAVDVIADRLPTELASLEKRVTEFAAHPSESDPAYSKAEREKLLSDLKRLPAWSQDVELLLKLTTRCAYELGTLDQDVPEMLYDLASLKPRMSALRRRALRCLSATACPVPEVGERLDSAEASGAGVRLPARNTPRPG